MESIPENVKQILKAVVPLVVIIILFIIAGQIGFGKIGDIRSQIDSATNNQTILNQKLTVLRDVSTSGFQFVSAASNAVPDSNTALSAISQIKSLASSMKINLSSIKSGSPGTSPSGISSVAITFNADGPRDQVEAFINAISTFAPITLVNKIKIADQGGGVAEANLSVSSYWASYPTKLPAITQPINALTSQENQVLQNVNSLTAPIFITLPPSTATGSASGNTNPFGSSGQ